MIRKFSAALLIALLSTQLAFAQGLRNYLSPAQFSIGAAVDASYLNNAGEPIYSQTVNNEYNIITPENDMKWGTIHPSQSTFNFSPGDIVASFAQKNGMHVRGHNLLWGQYNPGWLTNGQFTAAQLQSILENHITTVMTHYRTQFPGIVTTWDVVNEIINAGPGVWAPLGGSGDQVTQAFNISSIALRAARAADPSAKLCINEYSMERSGASTLTYQLVSRLKSAGVPLDCVGFQGHLAGSSVTQDQWLASLTAFNKLGVEVQITEFDVYNAPAGQYTNAINACLALPQCSAFLTWGFTDKYTWLGTSAHPLPFNESYQKKPAYTALDAALSNAARNNISVDAGGPSYTDCSKNTWLADINFSGGTPYSTTNPIAGTNDQILYQTERYGNFSYNFNIPNGNYIVLLKFAEIYWNKAGQRIFNVSLNGNPILQNFDIFASAGASFKAYDKSFPVTVTNNQIKLDFRTIVDNAKISAIRIYSSSTPNSIETATKARDNI